MGGRHPRRAGTPRPFDPFDCAQGTRTYRIEYTDDLRSGWQVLLDNIPGTGTLKTLDLPIPANHPQRFYRVGVAGQ